MAYLNWKSAPWLVSSSSFTVRVRHWPPQLLFVFQTYVYMPVNGSKVSPPFAVVVCSIGSTGAEVSHLYCCELGDPNGQHPEALITVQAELQRHRASRLREVHRRGVVDRAEEPREVVAGHL